MNDFFSKMSSAEIAKAEQELEQISSGEPSGTYLIDYDPNNTTLTKKENIYVGFFVVAALILLTA